MKIQIISSCTKAKNYPALLKSADLPLEDYTVKRYGRMAVGAMDLYSGRQHTYTKKAIRNFWTHGIFPSWAILSAGYGLIEADKKIISYDITLAGMKRDALKKWSDKMRVPQLLTRFLYGTPEARYVFLLLGKEYLTALQLSKVDIPVNKEFIIFTNDSRYSRYGQVCPIPQSDCKLLGCLMTAAKGLWLQRFSEELAGCKNDEVRARFLEMYLADFNKYMELERG